MKICSFALFLSFKKTSFYSCIYFSILWKVHGLIGTARCKLQPTQRSDKGISNFSEEIYYEGKLFRKNNEIQMNRMVSTTFEEPKSLTARSLQEKMDKVPYRFLIELICLFFIIDSTVLLNVFYLVNLEIWPFYEYLNLQVLSFF